jgi:hypothetical protein
MSATIDESTRAAYTKPVVFLGLDELQSWLEDRVNEPVLVQSWMGVEETLAIQAQGRLFHVSREPFDLTRPAEEQEQTELLFRGKEWVFVVSESRVSQIALSANGREVWIDFGSYAVSVMDAQQAANSGMPITSKSDE